MIISETIMNRQNVSGLGTTKIHIHRAVHWQCLWLADCLYLHCDSAIPALFISCFHTLLGFAVFFIQPGEGRREFGETATTSSNLVPQLQYLLSLKENSLP